MPTQVVRLRQHLYDEIKRRADEERRPISVQLEMLLEQALRINADAQPRDTQARAVEVPEQPVAPQAAKPLDTAPSPEAHFKPDFGKKLK